MANNELAIRFTEERYATKAEVARELRIQAIDSFWANILSYRNQYSRYLVLKSVDRSLFSVCLCPSISALLNNVENKLLRLNRNYCIMFRNPESLNNFNNYLKDRILKTNHNCSSYSVLLDYCYKNFDRNLDDNYLADLFATASAVKEITTFYRTDDSKTREYTALVDHIYNCAPHGLIEPMLVELFGFAKDLSLSSLLKTIVAYFYMSYINPFDSFSKNISMAYAKSILGKDALGELAFVLPLEEILFDRAEENQKIFVETQKTLDFTYILKFVLENLNGILDEIIPVSKKFASQVAEEKPSPELSEVRKKNIQLALKKEASPLTRTDAKKMEKSLLERDARLRQKEAHFYVEHCTIGKIYTLNHYKRFCRCAYETARTSMDRLAEFGYYKKEQLKNKFIYSPIAR